MSDWYVSCKKFTVCVTCADDGTITAAPPIVRKFIGQQLTNLVAWAGTRFGGTRLERLAKVQP